MLQASNGCVGCNMNWPNQAQQSSSSVYQAEEGSLSQSERQQQQYWQAFTQSLGQAPEQDAARAAQQAQQDARSRSSPGQAMQLQPQPSLPAVPEGMAFSPNAHHATPPYEQPASGRCTRCLAQIPDNVIMTHLMDAFAPGLCPTGCGHAVEESGINGAYSASRGSAGTSAVQQTDECPQPSDWDPSYRYITLFVVAVSAVKEEMSFGI